MGVGGQRHAQAAFTPGKDPVPTVQEAGWAPGMAWTGGKISPPPGFDPRTVQPLASRCTDYAILAPLCDSNISQNRPPNSASAQTADPQARTHEPHFQNSCFKLHCFLLQIKEFTYGDTTTTGPYSVRWRHRSTIFINSTSELVEVGTL